VTSTRPRVDVGVVTWNTRDLTVDALRRLLDTDQGVDITLYVRDNGSSDGTADAIAAQVPEAVLDAGPENLGFARGMNRCIRPGSASWFLALNSDAWPEPGAIAALLAAGEEEARVAAVAPRLERPDGTLEHSTHPFPRPLTMWRAGRPGWVRRNPDRARELLLHEAWDHGSERDVDWAVGAALLMRRSVIDSIGPFDERLFMYAEDLEWCWRAHRAGWTVRFTPRSIVRHVGNASASQNYATARSRALWRNTYRVYRWTHGPLSTLALRAAGAAGALGAALRARDAGVRDHFRRELRAHLTPVRGPDGPP